MYHLRMASVFTTLDCGRGFLQIPIREKGIPKTAFICCRSLYEYVRMPFGLSNSPATFQRLVDLLLRDAKDVFAMAYMDNIVVSSQMLGEHLEHVRIILQRSRDAGFTVNPGKVQLASSRVQLLEYVVDHGMVRPSEDKLVAILEYPPPLIEKCLRRFLVIRVFHNQFIPNYIQLSHTKLLNTLRHITCRTLRIPPSTSRPRCHMSHITDKKLEITNQAPDIICHMSSRLSRIIRTI